MKCLALLLVIGALVVACLPDGSMAPDDMAGGGDEKTEMRKPVVQLAALPSKEEGLVFPKSPMPQHLIVLNGQTMSIEMRFMMVSLQGILAKTEPRLYFNPCPLPWNDPTHDEEGRWLNEMETKWGVTSETASDPWAVLDQFIDEVEGFVVYDPDLPQSINVATTLAGIHHALVAHPDLIDSLTGRGLTAVEDLRGRFADNVELYTWAFENVWPLSNQTIVAFLAESLPTLRDYTVSNDIFVFQLDPHHYAERPLLESILDAMPRNIPIIGWPVDELLGIILFSQYGKYHVCSDQVSNLSAHSGLPRSQLTQDHITEWPNVENKIYVSFAYTDGDSITYTARWLADWFDDPAFGQIPLGWEISCNLVDLGPDILEYFYDHKTENDVIIGPASGVGYIYPNQYPDLPTFLDLTANVMSAADMRTLWLINDDLTLPDAIAVSYAEALDLLGIFIDYWPNSDKGWYLASDGTPVLRSRYVYLVGPEQIQGILDDAAVEKEFLYPDVPTFVFIGVNGWSTSPTYLKSIIDGLDERYEVLRPDAMFAAMRTADGMGLIP